MEITNFSEFISSHLNEEFSGLSLSSEHPEYSANH